MTVAPPPAPMSNNRRTVVLENQVRARRDVEDHPQHVFRCVERNARSPWPDTPWDTLKSYTSVRTLYTIQYICLVSLFFGSKTFSHFGARRSASAHGGAASCPRS